MALTRIIDGPEAFSAAFAVSRETTDKLVAYEALLKQWQKAVNLVAPSTLDEVWHRHFADSAQLVPLLGDTLDDVSNWLDLGSGAGFPGLVVAILLANRSNTRIHLVESNARKCAFLSEVVRQTGASVEIHASRIETLESADTVIRPEVVSARALAPLNSLLGLAGPFMGKGTRALFLKGKTLDEEMRDAQRGFSFTHTLHASMTDAEARIVEIENLRVLRDGETG